MPFTVSKDFDTPADRVWDLLIDTRTWPLWGPSVSAVAFPERFVHANAAGRIRTPIGIWLPFEVTRFEPRRFWDWRVAGVPATAHRVDPVGPLRCRVTFVVPTWAVGYGIVCQAALKRMQRVLTAQEGAP